MSRGAILLVLLMLGLTGPAHGQTAKAEPGADIIARAKKLSAMDKNGCLKPDDDPVILVCGESEDTKSQRVFRNQLPDPRFPNGAAQNEHAAACIPGTGCIPRTHGGVSIGFGKVPPPAIPLEEVYRGLPEPEDVVPEGEDAEQIPPL
jgi:hypothetical protein